MIQKTLLTIAIAVSLTTASASLSYADTDTSTANAVSMENCGAYLFDWRPIDCGNGQYFAILAGGTAINESDVILNRGYDYNYNFNYGTPRPWGEVPALVNIDGIWGIPDNWSVLPSGSQPTTRIVLLTNNNKLATNERYVDVVHLPGGVSTADLPPEVRKYLINTDGSDAGAYVGTETSGWVTENAVWKYRKPDGTFVTNSWLSVDDESYYMDGSGHMLADTITPDGIYVNTSGKRTNYIPGWQQSEAVWKYVTKGGYYAASTWIQDADGKWYYFDMAGRMVVNDNTPDGHYVNENGVWDGQATSNTANPESLGPGHQTNEAEPAPVNGEAGGTE